MNEKKKEYLQDKLNKTIEKSQLQVRGGLKEYSFDEDGVKKVLELLLKEDSWTEKFSERFLEEKLKEIIMKALDEGNTQNITNYLNDLITELGSYSLEQVVYIPIFGIKMSVPEKRIGNIIIKYMDEAKCIDLIQKTSSSKNAQEDLRRHILNHACAEFCIIAEPDRALERAEEETRRVIDLIRFSVPVIYPDESRVVIGLQGDVCRSWRYVPINPRNSEAFSSRGSLVGPLRDFEISDENIKIMEGIGVFKLSEMLRQQDEMGKFEATLITCIHWFSISQTKIELEDKLLNLITCLEIIFTPESKDPITQNIAEGTAILTENDVAKRKERVEKIRSLYGRRSSLSHHGKGKIYDFELRELRSIIGTALAILISRSGDFHNKDELHKWLEYIRLGGSTDLDKWTEYKLGNSPS